MILLGAPGLRAVVCVPVGEEDVGPTLSQQARGCRTDSAHSPCTRYQGDASRQIEAHVLDPNPMALLCPELHCVLRHLLRNQEVIRLIGGHDKDADPGARERHGEG